MIEKERTLPFKKEDIINLSKKFPTPFYIYDEEEIVRNAKELVNAFSWNKGFKEYFAVKALPNPSILNLLKKEGFGTDCSSLPELLLSKKVNLIGEDIIFTSNDTPIEEFKLAMELGAIVNLDDISDIDFLKENGFKLPKTICFRYNPGNLKTGNYIIGEPVEAKYGLTREQLFKAYKIAKDNGCVKFGLHTMVASNSLEENYFEETVKILLEVISELEESLNIKFDFIDIGGGFGIPYKNEEKTLKIKEISDKIKYLFNRDYSKNKNLKLFLELGRYITGPYGYLVTKVIHKKETYKNYIGVDANMANLMRPGMYGAYHEIIVLDKEENIKNKVYDVVGSLCENNDKFAINRKLTTIELGDYLTICDCGAHAHAMGFQYNGKLRSAEFLMNSKKEFKLIRRAETVNDYFATLNL